MICQKKVVYLQCQREKESFGSMVKDSELREMRFEKMLRKRWI